MTYNTLASGALISIWVFLTACPPLLANKKSPGPGYKTSVLLDQLLSDYDRRLRPSFGGPPTIVDVNLNIRSMGPVSEVDMAYQMDCYFRQSWVDRRLEFNSSEFSLRTLSVSINLLDRLWKPDTHFVNGQRSYLHVVTTPNKLLRINHNGRILYSMRLTIKASCPMHLEKFPMDIQSCPLQFGSHGYEISDVIYVWTNGAGNSIKTASDMRMSQFDVIHIPSDNSTVTHPTGTYSVLHASFVLKRHMGYFLINVYVPCSMLVMLSWVAFWINREATGDRIALGVTVVLTMAFLGIDTRTDLPKVSYSTALDYYVGICFAFVLATIIQFAGVHFFTKHGYGEIEPETESDEEVDTEDHSTSATPSREFHNSTSLVDKIYVVHRNKRSPFPERLNGNSYHTYRNTYGDPDLDLDLDAAGGEAGPWKPVRESCCYKFFQCLKGSVRYRTMKVKATPRGNGVNSVSMIDKGARMAFPASFIVFNVVYWSFYLRTDDHFKHLTAPR